MTDQKTDNDNTGKGGNMVPSTTSKSPTSTSADTFRDPSDRTVDNNDYTQPMPTVRRG